MHYIIGIDLGGTNLRVGLFDEKLQLKKKYIFSTKSFKDKEALIGAIIDSTKAILHKNALKLSQIWGVGLGLPGPVNYQKQIVHFFPNIKGWRNVYLGDILKEALGLEIFIDNDANLVCLAETFLGIAKGYHNVVGVTLGTGVGGGLVLEGKIYRGTDFVAGEIGHIPLNEKGPLCNCTGRACLESYIGSAKIMQEAKKVFKKEVSLEQLSMLAKKGNPKAIKIWQRVGERLGIVLSGVANLLNPQAVVIAGGVSKAGRWLFEGIRKTIRERAMPVAARRVKILKSYFKDDAGITGAALLVKMGVRKNVNFY